MLFLGQMGTGYFEKYSIVEWTGFIYESKFYVKLACVVSQMVFGLAWSSGFFFKGCKIGYNML